MALCAVLIEGQIMGDREVHRFQKRASVTLDALNESEINVLIDLAFGLSDRGMVERRAMS